MNLCIVNHNFVYELEKLTRIFLPFHKINIIEGIEESEIYAVACLKKSQTSTKLFASLFLDNRSIDFTDFISNSEPDYDKECERILAVLLFKCFSEITGYIPEWGILTGVRPGKLYSRMCDSMGDEKAKEYFSENFLVNNNKISLCEQTRASENAIINLSQPDSFSLYISIPFCPTRCSYCSFVSHSVDKAQKYIPEYISLLCREIEDTGNIVKKLNLKLETVYIGGGTPTTLTPEQLESVMSAVEKNFDLSNIREYTVEAGRPDTITSEKLKVIKSYNVSRTSINPQTLNDRVLKEIGRCHTVAQTEQAFYLAREWGFNNINMDLIAGLPTDDFESFKETLNRVIKLNPESVTVHSLAMKRASNLSITGSLPEIEAGKIAAKMVDYSRKALNDAEIYPYYMYRQSKTVGNLENTGYSRVGFECLYNVYIMDETHTILGCGASAVTKLREPGGSFIDRIFNFKYPYEYISRFDEILGRKAGINSFYEKYTSKY